MKRNSALSRLPWGKKIGHQKTSFGVPPSGPNPGGGEGELNRRPGGTSMEKEGGKEGAGRTPYQGTYESLTREGRDKTTSSGTMNRGNIGKSQGKGGENHKGGDNFGKG